MYLILALADDGLLFNSAHATLMKLPFREGWQQWCVFRQKNDNDLIFVERFAAYQEAERFINQQPVLTLEVARSEDRVH